ncbi:hypothetical protein BpHYR1_018249 [Brachionus plicatilis]|uniref:Uncharacterized protein n=1 Tax=Brachionus plicatilis TaxID=10195 RepID=A0A3M7PLN8_BRAPC|nr:hypothetical protein BpHYR1_018249 [Brachionus plicatilis]
MPYYIHYYNIHSNHKRPPSRPSPQTSLAVAYIYFSTEFKLFGIVKFKCILQQKAFNGLSF